MYVSAFEYTIPWDKKDSCRLFPTWPNFLPFIKEDAEALTDFLCSFYKLTNFLCSFDKSVSWLRTKVAILQEHPDKEKFCVMFKKEVSLKGLSALLYSLKERSDIDPNGHFFLCCKDVLHGGAFFCDKFLDVFQWSFIKKMMILGISRESVAISEFFKDYVPTSDAEMFYGIEAFNLFKKTENLGTWEADRLVLLEKFIDRIIRRQNVLTCVAFLEPASVGRGKGEFMHRMTEKLRTARNRVQSLISERFSDSQYWKVSTHFNDKEAKKIFDELEGKEEKTVEHNH